MELAIVSIKSAPGDHTLHHDLQVPLVQNGVHHNVVDDQCQYVASGQSQTHCKWCAKEGLLSWYDHVALPKHGNDSDNVGANAIILKDD